MQGKLFPSSFTVAFLGCLTVILTSGCNLFELTGEVQATLCSGHGVLDPNSENNTCSCDPGYQGSECESCAGDYQDNDHDKICKVDCANSASVQCKAHTVCDDSAGTAVCVCEAPYQGNDCNECAPGFQDNDKDGNCAADCRSANADCGGHGTCDDSSGSLVCLCDAGYQDNDQNITCLPSCTNPSFPCVHGTCSDASGQAVCQCAQGFEGAACDRCANGLQDNDNNGTCLPTCATLGYTCSFQGTCSDASGTAVCNCNTGFVPDGNGNCIGTNYYIGTAVNDGLDQGDLDLMIQGLTSLGYLEKKVDRNVSTAAMTSYVGETVTLLYHTGHGNVDLVATSTGAYYSSTAKIKARNVIWGTCLTLSSTNWKSAFTDTTENIMGYTNYSFDITDNEQVNRYVAELKKGRNHLQAWYTSNVAISDLQDRWAAYSREGSNIVEYSARTGHNPSKRAQMAYVPLEPNGQVHASVGLLAEVRYWNYSQPVVHIDSSEDLQTQIDAEGFRSLPASLYTKSSAVDIADAWLAEHGSNAPDAFVDEVIEVVRRVSEDAEEEVVAHIVTYGRRVNGLPVRGNRLVDHTAVLVSDRGVSVMSHYWPELRVEEATKQLPMPLLSANDAIQMAAEEIARVTKGAELVKIDEAVDVYGTVGDASKSSQLVPAYEFRTADGLRIVVDAATGKIL